MTIDPAVVGFEYEPVTVELDPRSLIAYALAVGAGSRSDELQFVYEQGLVALPTFPVVTPTPIFTSFATALGVDPAAVLHGEQRLELHRPMPARGRLDVRPRVVAAWDKGSGAVIDTRAEIDVDGERIATATYGSFVRGGGGFGGERGSGLTAAQPDRPPDLVVEERTIDRQAQLYRLTGDTNPLHVDPEFARRAGFDRPILHGLCSYGFAVRMAMHALADGEAARVTAANARFTGVVYPGEELTLELWRLSPERAYGRLLVKARDAVVIDPLEFSTTPPSAP